MKSGACEQCGAASPLGTMYYVTQGLTQKLQCTACTEKLLAEAGQNPPAIQAAVDPTVCSICESDYGSTELPRAGVLPLCENCRSVVYERPFPRWLKLSFAALVALLVLALSQGARYFTAGRALIHGERLINQEQYTAAAPLLEQTLKVAPSSQKAILLAAKAYLLSGQPGKADDTLKLRPTYKNGEHRAVRAVLLSGLPAGVGAGSAGPDGLFLLLAGAVHRDARVPLHGRPDDPVETGARRGPEAESAGAPQPAVDRHPVSAELSAHGLG